MGRTRVRRGRFVQRAVAEVLEPRRLLTGTTATVSGTVFDDLNGSGARDAGEPALSGRTVFLDANRNGVPDAGEPSTTSDANGLYQITGVAPGSYDFVQVLPSGWRATSAAHVQQNLVAGQSDTGIDFGSLVPPPPTPGLDATFGAGGEVLDAGAPGAQSLIRESNGRLLAVAGARILAFTPGGAVDGSFGVGGAVNDPLASVGATSLHGVAQADGKIVLVGIASSGPQTEDLVVSRVNADGSVDAQFNGGAPAFAGLSGVLGSSAVAVGADGSIVVGGSWASSSANQQSYVGLARLTAAGTPDATFGDGGRAVINLPSRYTLSSLSANALAMAADDSVLVAGQQSAFTGPGSAFLLRVSPAGALDATFGTGGVVLQQFQGTGTWNSVRVTADGKIIVGGQGFRGFAVGRYNANGTPDVTFGNGGVVETSAFAGAAAAWAVVADVEPGAGGRVVAIGTAAAVSANCGDVAVAVYLPTGQLDPGYGKGGAAVVPFTNGGGAAAGIALPDGRLVVAADAQAPLDELAVMQFAAPAPTVWGTVYQHYGDDAGIGAGGQPAAPSSTVFADLNSDGMPDNGEPSATTGPNGAYALAVPVGVASFTLGVVPPPGYQLAAPASGAYSVTTPVALDAGPLNFGVKAAPTATVSGTAYNDANANGSLDAGEQPLAGLTVYADVNGNGTRDPFEPTAVTDASGNYTLTGIFPGALVVREVLPPNRYISGPPGAGAVTVSGGQTLAGVNFYDALGSSVTGVAYEELDGNNPPGPDDPRLAGRLVYLDTNFDGKFDGTDPWTTTAADGTYLFAGLPAADYAVGLLATGTWGAVAPGSAQYLAGGGTTDTIDVAQAPTCGISGIAFSDVNGNAVRDAGELPLAGRTVFLDANNDDVPDNGEPTALTNADGVYFFNNPDVTASTVQVREVLPIGWRGFRAVFGWTAYTHQLQNNLNFADVAQPTTGSIEGMAFSDLNGNGRWDAGESATDNDGTVYVDLNGNGIPDAGEPQTTMGYHGYYEITGLAAGTYTLRLRTYNDVDAPAGARYQVTLAAGQTVARNFGITTTPTSIYGNVWGDANANGAHDPGESTLPGVTVFLDSNNNGRLDAGEPWTVTDSSGGYLFNGLAAGIYTLRANLAGTQYFTLPAGGSQAVTLSAAAPAPPSQDFYVAPAASISGTVYNDAAAVGGPSAAATGLTGRTVYLDLNGDALLDNGEPSVTTGTAGGYQFAHLKPGQYTVREVLPVGWRQTSPTGGTGWTATLAGGQSVAWNFYATNLPPVAKPGGPYTVAEGGSAGLTGAASSEAFGSIAKYEWDTNYNGTTFNPVLTGVGPTFAAAGLDGPTTRTIALRVTDANGLVSAISTTTLSITNAPPTAAFTGSTVTQGSAGTVGFSGQKDPSPADVSAGFKYSYDFNNDGTFDVVDSTSAAAAVPAPYLATVGSHTVKGRIKDKDGGYTDYTTTVTVNAPAAATGSIAGTAFNDANGNGVRDSLEGAMANVTLYLDANKDGKYEAGEPTAVTNASGAYVFKNLPGGVTYRVREVLPSGYRVSSPTSAYADVALAAGQAVGNVTFADTRTVLFAGQVFNDANANGGKDATETALAGWTVYLDTNKNGVKDAGEPTTTTDAAGNYRFVLPPPSVATAYAARVVLPSGWRQTYPSGSAAQSATLSAGGGATGRNFLATQRALISGTVFADANGDGVRQSTELGLSGWRVFVDANNDGVFESSERSVLTDGSGNWNFTTLTAGTYVLRVVPQTGYARTTPTTGIPAGSYTVTVANGQVRTGFAFGEKKIA